MLRTARARRLAVLLVAVPVALAAVVAGGCTKAASTAPSAEAASSLGYPVTITDDASRTVTVKAQPKRIVSLAPANTEILFALGDGERVVGVTSYDDYPAEVKSIAKVGDFAGPNMEAVAAADPDVVFVTTGVQADVIGKLEDLGAVVVAVDPQTLDGLYDDIGEIAAVTGSVKQGALLVGDMKRAVDKVRGAVAGKPPVDAFIEIGQNPLYTAGSGTLMDEMISLAGGRNVVTNPGYVPYSVEQLVKSDPAVYFVTQGVASDPSAIEKRAGYSKLSAIKDGRVVILEDNLVSRPGPRIVQGLQLMAEGLHPESFGK